MTICFYRTNVTINRSSSCWFSDLHWVEVSGSNPGSDDLNGYRPCGWMERALTEAEYINHGSDQYIIDDVARSIKAQTNSDAVIVLYFTPDVSSGYAVPLESGVYGESGCCLLGRSTIFWCERLS